MKLHLLTDSGLLLFTGYGTDHVVINGQRQAVDVLLRPHDIEIAPWAGQGVAALAPAHFEWIAARKPDIVLLGTGTRPRFPHPSLARPLMEARIGLEVMDVGALCRTYNILAGEGRAVAAAVAFDRTA